MSDPVSIERNAAIEWPTVALFAAIYAAFLGLTWFHAQVSLWFWLPLAAWFSAWWGSAQHEALHGHPTRARWLNKALATPPFWLWLPFECCRHSHLTHHSDERLTDPRDNRKAVLTENGGLLYAGYWDVFRRFFLKGHDQPVHPLGRVPESGDATVTAVKDIPQSSS